MEPGYKSTSAWFPSLTLGDGLQALVLNSFGSEGLELWSGDGGLTDFQRRSHISHVFEKGLKDFHCSGSVVGRSPGLQGEHSQDECCDVMVGTAAFSTSFPIWHEMRFCK